MAVIEIIQSDAIKLMSSLPDKSIDVILCDIPYNEVNQKSSGLRKLDRLDADRMNFDLDIFLSHCSRLSKGSIYIFCGIGQISKIDSHFRSVKMTTRLCQWEKTNPSPMNGSRLWLSGSEFCVFSRNPKAKFNRHCEKPIWKFPVGRSKIHPTEKPLKLMEYILESSGDKGDLVADFTVGSGTTALAAKNLGMSFIGCDISAEYVELAKERIEA